MSHACYTSPSKRILVALLTLAAALSAGCAEFVGSAARSSLAGFLTSVASTAINESVGP